MAAHEEQRQGADEKTFWDWLRLVLKHAWKGTVFVAIHVWVFLQWAWRKIRNQEPELTEPRHRSKRRREKEEEDEAELVEDVEVVDDVEVVEEEPEPEPEPQPVANAQSAEREQEQSEYLRRMLAEDDPERSVPSEVEQEEAEAPARDTDFETAATPPAQEAVQEPEEENGEREADYDEDFGMPAVPTELPPEPEEDEEEVMTREAFVRIMSQSHQEFDEFDSTEVEEEEEEPVPEPEHPGPFHESSVIDTQLKPLFELDKHVKVQPLTPSGAESLDARIIHVDDEQVILLRKEADTDKGNLDVGEPIVLYVAAADGQRHEIRTQVSNSNGAESTWFSIAVSREAVRRGLPAGINLPVKFYVVFGAQSKAEALDVLSRPEGGETVHTSGMIRELDVNGMLLETEMELPEREFLIQDPRQEGILSRMELSGYVLNCSQDLQAQDKYLSTIQFDELPVSTEQQIRAITGRGFLGNI